MIVSLYRVVFRLPSGRGLVLLDFGQDIDAEIALPVEQQGGFSAALLAAWGRPMAQGAARGDLTFTVHRPAGSKREEMSFCARHSASMPWRVTGSIEMSFRNPGGAPEDDEIWRLTDAMVTSCVAQPDPDADDCGTVTSYRINCGKRYPIQGNFGWGNLGGWILIPAGQILALGGSTDPDVDSYTPPAPTPGTPPAVAPAGSVSPATPPALTPAVPLVPGTPPAFHLPASAYSGILLTGISDPLFMSGTKVLPLVDSTLPHDEFLRFELISGGNSILVSRSSPGFPWVIGNSDGTLVAFLADQPAELPWFVQSWTAVSGTGTPIITPILT